MSRIAAMMGLAGLLLMTSAINADYDSLLKDRNERISKKVEEEVNRQLESMQRKVGILQNKLDEYRSRGNGGGTILKSPWLFKTFNAWKEYLREQPEVDYLPELQDEEVSFTLSHSWGHRAHDNNGKRQDISFLAFGQPSFTFKEAFFASDLLTAVDDNGSAAPQAVIYSQAAGGTAVTPANHYLHILSDQVLKFDASCNRQVFDLAYQRTFRDKRLTVRFNLPLVREEHRIELSKDAEITTENRTALNAAGATPKFYKTYTKMQDFLEKTFLSNGTQLKRTQEEYGIGDISVAASYLCKLRYIDSTHVGAKLTLGTGRANRGVTVWQPELGNGGGTAVHVMGSAEWHRGHFANPFVRLSLGYNFPFRKPVRVPQVVSNNTGDAGSRFIDILGRRLPWSDVLEFNANPFVNKSETEMKHVASHLQRATLTKGFEAQLSFGNKCEQCFNRPITCAIEYNLFLRESEKLSSLSDDATYNVAAATRNTYRAGHTIKTDLGYRFNDTCFFNSAFSYCFAGRNVPALLSLQANLTARF